ncbi:MAG TPA: phage major capsid protein [Candidatus Gemmiger excrementipullorum]|uniref:Phage major capsid protein n=1 Tax=Candidatus Gemmiger excrementipullorum TaxID=2838610 RepID=A0A9D2BUU0_9FIRM|nr:phage major capsid protein [Candidatus Gemmiger excrementipullorum]
MAAISMGTNFPPELVKEMMNQVVGHSSLARLSARKPIPFTGEKIFTFSLDKEADIVAENGAKSAGGATLGTVNITPIKLEYSARVSDEFMRADEEYQLNVLEEFAEGAAKKFARALDLAAFHGVNPRTNADSAVVGENNFDDKIENVITYASATPDDNLDAAIAAVIGAEKEVTGIAMSPTMGAAMAKVKVNGVVQYPEFRFGGKPQSFAGMGMDINNTVSKMPTSVETTSQAYVGDFANAFRWGYATEMPVEIIPYGNPDNDTVAGDLKGKNQVLLRLEAFIGWGILDPDAFAVVQEAAAI